MMLTLAAAIVLQRAGTATGDQLSQAVANMRQTLIEYKLDFDAVLRQPSFRDPDRMNRYPGNTWPEMLGILHYSPTNAVANITGQGAGYDPSAEGGFAVSERLVASLQPKNYQMLFLLGGVAPKAGVVANTYSAVYCKGDMEGVLNFNSYATAIVQGNMKGLLYSDSYFNAVIFGDLAGSYENASSCMVYVLGRLTGSVKLNRGAKLVIYGKTSAADLARIKGTGSVWLLSSDLPAGTQKVGNLTVTVGTGTEGSEK